MTVGAEEQAEARREIVASAVMLVAALTVLTLAMRGTFSAMWRFPLIFAVIMAVLAIVSLRKARGVLWKPRLLLAVAIIALSALAPVLHPRGVLRKMEAYEQRASAALSGTPAPAIPFVRSIGLGDGGAGSLAPGGEPTLINFWATWCGPCVDELPMIERFWKDHRDSGLDVVGVTKLYDGPDADAEAQKIRDFLDGLGVTFPVVIADEDSPSHAAYGVESLPSSVLVDRHGTVIAFGVGVRGTVRLMRLAEERAGASFPDPD